MAEPTQRPVVSRRELSYSLAWTLGVSVLGMFANVLLQRSLGRAGSGLFENVSLVILLCEMAVGVRALGLTGVLVVGKEPGAYPRVMRRTLLIYGGVALLLVALGWAGAIPSARTWAGEAGLMSGILAAGLLVFPSLLVFHQMLLMGAGSLRGYALSLLADQGLFCAGLLLLSGSGMTVTEALAVRAGASLGALLLTLPGTLPALKALPAWRDDAPPVPARSGLLVRCIVVSLLSTVAGRAEVLVLSAVSGVATGGDYRISLIVGTAFLALPTALGNLLFPRVAFASSRPEPVQVLHLLRRSGIALGLGTLLCGLLAPFAVPAVFGPAYAGAVAPLLLRLPGIWAYALHYTLMNDVSARSRYPAFANLSLLALCVVSVGGTVLLAPRWGACGAATAFSLGAWLALFWLLRGHFRSTGLSWRHLGSPRPRPDPARPVASSILLGG